MVLQKVLQNGWMRRRENLSKITNKEVIQGIEASANKEPKTDKGKEEGEEK
jgi:hypothetical protein